MNEEVWAYYYGFELTGVDFIDQILREVARAGKSYHHTEDWSEPEWGRKQSPVERIQQAANAAAEEWKR